MWCLSSGISFSKISQHKVNNNVELFQHLTKIFPSVRLIVNFMRVHPIESDFAAWAFDSDVTRASVVWKLTIS